jgi:hypothetical protein
MVIFKNQKINPFGAESRILIDRNLVTSPEKEGQSRKIPEGQDFVPGTKMRGGKRTKFLEREKKRRKSPTRNRTFPTLPVG